MDTRIEKMLEQYSSENKEYVVKEIIQEIVLSGLSRSDFFKYCAFYGGTALRIIHKINRFSVDLDFVLYEDKINFKLEDYKKYIEDELKSYGLNFKLVIRESKPNDKMARGNVKGNLKEAILTFYPKDDANKYNPEEVMRVKLEVCLIKDKYALTETVYQLLPIPYQMTTYDLPSLFSSKIAALLTRNYINNEKGRDYYDYLYYIQLKVKPNMEYLKEKIVKAGMLKENVNFDYETLLKLLLERFKNVNYEFAKNDIKQFIEDKKEVDLWSYDFFAQITKKYFDK